MFLDWAAKLKLLEYDSQTNVLKDFPLPVRKILVAEVVNYLHEAKFGKDILTSPAHVRWAMETVGQGFTLPIEDQDIIQKCIVLYRVWTLEPTKRPKPINEDPQFFTQRLIEHFSMIFAIRASTTQQAMDHAGLCSTVLDIYAVLGRHFGDKLSVGTWEVFLKLMISITDSILRREGVGVLEPMQKRLASQLLRVLFELWLFSGTRNPAMWDALKLRVAGWTRHMALMVTWKAVCFALTKRIIGILYGINEGTDSIVLKIEEDIQSIRASDVDVFYAWQRMLHILGDPNDIVKDPVIYLAFMGGVEMLVNQFLKISVDKSKPRNVPPDANTIFHIFGPWLFDAVHLDRLGFEEGTALALKIQTHIILSKQSSLDPLYLASFCSCLQQALCKEGRVLLAAISKADVLIMRNEIRGIRALVPSFIYATHRILTKRVQPFDHIQPAEHVRRSCLQLLGALMCLPNHFGEAQFKLRLGNVANSQAAKSFDVNTYAELKSHISITLIEALTNESFPPNLEMLLFLMFAWHCEDIDNSRDFSVQCINLILRKLTSHTAWPTDVMLTGLRVLSAMSRLYVQFGLNSDMPKEIAAQLCKYCESLCHLPSRPQGKDEKACEEIAATCFVCISDWVMVDQWVTHSPDIVKLLLSSVVVGLTGKKSAEVAAQIAQIAAQAKKPEPMVPAGTQKPPKGKFSEKRDDNAWTPISERIKEAAHSTLLTLLNHTGNFPTESGPASVSSTLTEDEILANIVATAPEFGEEVEVNERHQYMRYFITDDKVILGVIDQPYGVTVPGPLTSGLTIIVRDKTGKYAWDAILSFISRMDVEKPINIPEDMNVPISVIPHGQSLPQTEETKIDSIMQYVQNKDAKDAAPIAQAQAEAELLYLQQNEFNLKVESAAQIPQKPNPYNAQCKMVQARMLLSHLGYLSLENRGTLYPINMTSGFFNSLKLLDQVPERECVKVGCVFVPNNSTSEQDWYSVEGGSRDFQELVAALGWGINVAEHEGFIGSLDRKLTTGDAAPYWANYSTEVVFHVTTLMPNGENGDYSHKKRQINNVYALVVWTEDDETYSPDVFWKEMKTNAVQIVITPLKQQLYYVRLFTKNSADRNSIGPVIHGMVLSKNILGTLVRETAILAHRRDRSIQEGGITQMQVRKQFIEDLFVKYKKDTSLDEFYGSLFTNLPPDQTGPPPIRPGHSVTSFRKPYNSPARDITRDSSASPLLTSMTTNGSSPTNNNLSSGSSNDFGTIRPSGKREGGVMMGSRSGATLGGSHRSQRSEDLSGSTETLPMMALPSPQQSSPQSPQSPISLAQSQTLLPQQQLSQPQPLQQLAQPQSQLPQPVQTSSSQSSLVSSSSNPNLANITNNSPATPARTPVSELARPPKKEKKEKKEKKDKEKDKEKTGTLKKEKKPKE